MNLIIGIVVAFVCTIGGYVAEGGHIEVLLDAAPMEMVIMGGTAVAGFIIGNPKTLIFDTLRSFKLLLKGAKYSKASYIDLLSMMYQMFKLAKLKGMLALEAHVEKPEESSIFTAFPSFLKEHHAVEFFCDYLRLVTLGADKPYELEALMDEELEAHHSEHAAIVAAVQVIADGMPAIGIVACVLGVIHTMGAIAEPPEVLGRLIGGAMCGTFMGVWSSYGFVGPIGNSLSAKFGEDAKYYQCIKLGLLAYLQGAAPSIAVEYARKALDSHVRPTFAEVEEATQALPAPS